MSSPKKALQFSLGLDVTLKKEDYKIANQIRFCSPLFIRTARVNYSFFFKKFSSTIKATSKPSPPNNSTDAP